VLKHTLSVGLLLALWSTGCATTRPLAAKAMQCPEASLESVEAPAPPTEAVVKALLLLPLTERPLLAATAPRRGEYWKGCGLTVVCERETAQPEPGPGECHETPDSRANRLTKALPALMERSRARLGADAKAEQTGYFSWTLSASSGTAECNVLDVELFRCRPDLDTLQPASR